MENSQQTLSLEDELIFENSSQLNPEAEVDKLVEPDVNLKTTSKTIVFDLEDKFEDIPLVEESADEVISSIILDEEPLIDKQIDILEIEDKIIEDPTLNTLETALVNTEGMKVESREREKRLRNISLQLRTPSGLTSLEDVPAYKRNNVEISESTHSSESELSSYTLNNRENNTTELKQNNSFLHDNVD